MCFLALSTARVKQGHHSFNSALILVSNNILLKEEPVLLGEMADSRAGRKEVLEKDRETERGAGEGRRKNREGGRQGKGRKKKTKNLMDTSSAKR